MVLIYIWVALGSAIGGVFRFALSLLIASWAGEAMPWGTLAVNVLGSFAIGLFAAATVAEGRLPVSPELRLFVMIGVCGGFTTFSSFSLQTLALFEGGAPMRAAANVALSVVLCLLSVWLGALAGGWINAAGKGG